MLSLNNLQHHRIVQQEQRRSHNRARRRDHNSDFRRHGILSYTLSQPHHIL